MSCKDDYIPKDGGLKLCKRAGEIAYVRNLEDGPIIVFCPFFFFDGSGEENFLSLDDTLKVLKAAPTKQTVCKAFKNSGFAFLHEMMHVKVIFGDPPGQYSSPCAVLASVLMQYSG